MSGVKLAAIAAGVALVAVGAAAPFTDLPVRAGARVPDVLSMLHKRSPEERQAGALIATKGRVSVKLLAAVTPAKAPKVPAAVVPTAAAAPLPVAQAPVALPLAVVPAVTPAVPVVAVPAAAGSSFFIPPVIVPGGGGSSFTPLVTPPPGGSTPPPPVPGVPEPQTWAMMIIGFGLLGLLLRRRRRISRMRGVALQMSERQRA